MTDTRTQPPLPSLDPSQLRGLQKIADGVRPLEAIAEAVLHLSFADRCDLRAAIDYIDRLTAWAATKDAFHSTPGVQVVALNELGNEVPEITTDAE